MSAPLSRKRVKNRTEGVDKRRLQITKRKIEGVWVEADFGAEGEVGDKASDGGEDDGVVDEGPEWGDEARAEVVEVLDPRY